MPGEPLEQRTQPLAGAVCRIDVTYSVGLKIARGDERAMLEQVGTGGAPLSQLWVFLIAPLVGAVLAAGIHILFYPLAPDAKRPRTAR